MAFAALALCAAVASPAGVPALVADLGDEVDLPGSDIVASPSWTELDGVVYFFHDDGIHGRELWRSDGSALGTFLLRDVCPGSCSGVTAGHSAVLSLGAALGQVFFAGNDGVHGAELWRSDGTALGTRMVADIRPGAVGSMPALPREIAGQMVFVANDGIHGSEVWRSDGTAKGTYLLADVTPGPEGAVSDLEPGPGWIWAAVGGDSPQLWRIDGTAEGTFPLAPAALGAVTMPGRMMAALGQRVVVLAGDGLWGSDGTPEGTTLLHPDARPTRPLVQQGDRAYFLIGNGDDRRLWRTDGTPAGTQELAFDVAGPFALSYLSPLVEVDETTIVALGRSDAAGSELASWVDGSPDPEVFDLWPGPTGSLDPLGLIYGRTAWRRTPAGLVFVADDGARGAELWRSDGSLAGTVPLPELVPGPEGLDVALRNATWRSTNGVGPVHLIHWSSTGGFLARSDGTAPGTRVVREIRSQTSAWPRDLHRGCTSAIGRRLLVSTADVYSSTVSFAALAVEGAEVIPGLLGEIVAFDTYCAPLGQRAAVLVRDPMSGVARWWITDATAAGTQDLGEVAGTGNVVARADDVVWLDGATVWRSDGSPGGATPVGTLPTAPDVAFPTASGDVLFAGSGGSGLLRGAVLDPLPALDSWVLPADLGSGVLTLAPNTGGPERVWMVVEGDPALVRPLAEGATYPSALGVFDFTATIEVLASALDPKRAVLAIGDADHGAEPWVTDGTPEGTELLLDLWPGPESSAPKDFVQLGEGVVAFAATDEIHGRELWFTDGTAAGTQVIDLVPGPASSLPQQLTAIDGVLLFSAWTEPHGREAWWSDGTPAGTVRISDVAPGPKSSSPERFARAGRRLYFLATDHQLGFEWWSADVPAWAGIFADGFESGDLGEWSGATP